MTCTTIVLFTEQYCIAEKTRVLGVYGSVEPGSTISVAHQTGKSVCYGESDHPNLGHFCIVDIPSDAEYVRVEVARPGFKRYSENFRLTNMQPRVVIGTIKLVPSQLPKIEQIILSKKSDAAVRFELSLHNPSKQEVLITKLQFSAEAPIKPGSRACHMSGPDSVFSIEKTLTIIAGGERERSVEGHFYEVTRGKEYRVEAQGSYIIKEPCGGNTRAITMTLPSSFVLPAHEFTTIELLLPTEFRVKSNLRTLYSGPSEEIIPIDNFKTYHFKLHPSSEDEVDLQGTYKNGEFRFAIDPSSSLLDSLIKP